jgi:glycosyltransferase involved in cell wall biosynthesis
VIRSRRPATVIATNPSIVLSLLLLLLRRYYGFALISDAHYLGVRAMNGSTLWQKLLDFHNQRADLVIVTNSNHAQYLTDRGCRTYVCPDPLPNLRAAGSPAASVPAKAILLVCSFDADEPHEAAFAAFARLQPLGFVSFVSGNYRKARVDPAAFPWVNFLGFVSEEEYYTYLQQCSVVVDLTSLEDCLLCGAYEALAAGRPLVTSNTRALREYFGAAALLTENTPGAIAALVERAYAQREELRLRISAWVVENERWMQGRIAELAARLQTLPGAP